jgi:hypothetical protein
MTFEFADQKLTQATRTIATGMGTVQQRVREAFARHLAQVDPRDLPEHLRIEFASLRLALEGSAADDLSADAARELGAVILRLQQSVAALG